MSKSFTHLFAPLEIRHLTLKNRICMSPVSTNFSTPRGEVTPRLLDHYGARARGGAGLIIIEGTCVHLSGRAFVNQLGAYEDSFIPGLESLARTIRTNGAASIIQLHHGGRQANPKISGIQPLAPSAVACPISRVMPKEMTHQEIAEIRDAFIEAAFRGKEAGFDGVEFHAAHEYLVSEFLSPYTNKRTDEYGGGLENRLRLLVDIIRGARLKLGPDFIISVRMNGDDYIPGGLTIADAIEIARVLEAEGVDILNVSGGVYVTPHLIIPPLPLGPGVHLHLSAAIKGAVSIPVIGVGRITTPEFAERALAEGRADLVALGRALVADPEWPQKALEGNIDDIRPCLGCNQGCIDNLLRQKDITCTLNPAVGQDRDYTPAAAEHPQTVVVVGGGPAGMEAARVAALRGHKVFLYEKSARLGGQLNLASVSPHKESFQGVARYLEGQLKSLDVAICLGVEADRRRILDHSPQVVILATGSVPVQPPISGLDGPRVVRAHDVLAGRVETGCKVAVLGGGMTGCETAHYLTGLGKEVVILEQLKRAGQDIGPARRSLLFQALKEAKVQILTNCAVHSIEEDRVNYLKMSEEPPVSEALSGIDTFVNALGVRPFDPLSEELKDYGGRLEVIGDARSTGTCLHAIAQGAKAALSI